MRSELLRRWRTDYVLWVETFAVANLAFLALDIYVAHSENGFLRRAEWVPLFFSLAAPLLLVIALWARYTAARPRLWSGIGYGVGAIAIGLGLTGVIYHLDSQFFYERTLRSLTYAAPFAAPLAYTGVGMLLILNRMERAPSEHWGRWIVFLAMGGFFGDFVLSLTDHAENGFFHWTEWIPVVSSSFAVAFLAVFFFVPATERYVRACAVMLAVQVLIGAVGFLFHTEADLHGVSKSFFQNVINGAPPFAPLLFPNLAILAGIGLWVVRGYGVGSGREETGEE
jgi:hypothetical protein